MHVRDDTYHFPSPANFQLPCVLTIWIRGLQIRLDRNAQLPLSEQIRLSIARAIESGVLTPGTRLPSWQDLAARLGVARGTVQAAYERLSDAQIIETFGARGTRVAPRPRVPMAEPARRSPGHS